MSDAIPVIQGEWSTPIVAAGGTDWLWGADGQWHDPGESVPTVAITIAGIASDTIRASFQVSTAGRWLLDIYISASADSDPSAAGNTISLVTGFEWHGVIADAAYTVLTNTAGLAEIDLQIAGTAARRFHALVRPIFAMSGTANWPAVVDLDEGGSATTYIGAPDYDGLDSVAVYGGGDPDYEEGTA